MRNIKIGTRAILVLSFFILLILVSNLLSVSSQKNIDNKVVLIESHYVPVLYEMYSIRIVLNQISNARMENIVDYYRGNTLRNTNSDLNNLISELRSHEDKLSHLVIDPLGRQRLKKYQETSLKITQGGLEANQLILDGKVDEARIHSEKQVAPYEDEAFDQVAELIGMAEKKLKSTAQEANKAYDNGFKISLILTITALFISIILARLFIRSLTEPLSYAVNSIQAMANNDLTKEIVITGKDEATQILSNLKTMQQNLAKQVTAIIQSSTQLSASAEQLSVVTNQTSEGVLAQRNETEQVATAMNEMTATVHEVAQNSEQTAAAASTAFSEVTTSAAHLNMSATKILELAKEIDTASQAIGKLNQDSQEISLVLDAINNIAEQTNLLALNAAIEAARAGEAGRGFAVVADEVRNLAQRTQESTNQTEQLIANLQAGSSNAVEQMQTSSRLANEASSLSASIAKELDLVTASIQATQDMTSQIATAAEEQSSVAEEINRSVVRVNDVAEQSATAVEETSTQANELARLSEELRSLVSKHKV